MEEGGEATTNENGLIKSVPVRPTPGLPPARSERQYKEDEEAEKAEKIEGPAKPVGAHERTYINDGTAPRRTAEKVAKVLSQENKGVPVSSARAAIDEFVKKGHAEAVEKMKAEKPTRQAARRAYIEKREQETRELQGKNAFQKILYRIIKALKERFGKKDRPPDPQSQTMPPQGTRLPNAPTLAP